MQAKQDHMLHNEIQISGLHWHLFFFFFFFCSLAQNPYFYWEFMKRAKPAVRQPVTLFGTLIIFFIYFLFFRTLVLSLEMYEMLGNQNINNGSTLERQWMKYTCASEITPKNKPKKDCR